MGKQLRAYVHVHQDDGSVNVYGPDDEVPAEDAKKIGDHAWIDEEDAEERDDRLGVHVDAPKGAAKASKPRRQASRGSSAPKDDGPPAGAAKSTGGGATPNRPRAAGKAPAKKAADKPDGDGDGAGDGAGSGSENQ